MTTNTNHQQHKQLKNRALNMQSLILVRKLLYRNI